MLEPVHGSAPDIAGKFICNPVNQIWRASLMLEHLGEVETGKVIVEAVETLLCDSASKTRDMGGQTGTADVGKALAEIVAQRYVLCPPSCRICIAGVPRNRPRFAFLNSATTVDVNGDGFPDFSILAKRTHTLGAPDFVLW